MVDIKPLLDMILVVREPFRDEVSSGGIIMSAAVQEKENQNLLVPGIVVAVGPGPLRDSRGRVCTGRGGKPIEHDIQPGDRVMVARYTGFYVEYPKAATPDDEGHGGIALIPARDVYSKLEVPEKPPMPLEVPRELIQ